MHLPRPLPEDEMYTLISASVLALDLARHPGGAAVADVLDSALALEHVPCLREPGVVDLDRAAARARLLAVAEQAPRLTSELRSATTALRAALDPTGPDGPSAPALDTSALRAALVGRLPDLVALLQHELGEVRALPRPVVDVVVDRAAAAWTAASPDARPADVAALSAGWTALVGELPAAPPRTGDVARLLDLLETVARTDAASWAGLEHASAGLLSGLRWSGLMHTASRVAVEGDRTLDVARWQLSAVRALASAGHVRRTCTPGAAMAVVAAVQALALLDLLPATVVEALTEPCRDAGVLPV